MPEIAFTGIDAYSLADAGQTLSGPVAVKNLPRLQAAALAVEVVQAELCFSRDPAGRCLIAGTASAEVTQTCQRCMEPVNFPVETEFTLLVISSEQEAKQLPETLPGDPEPIIQERRLMDAAALVEDELLLALPLITRHDDSLSCGPQTRPEPTKVPESVTENRPFQVLKDMKLH